MRTTFRVLGSILAVLVLFQPLAVSAKRITVAGSLAITRDDDALLKDELVVTAVMSNPGLEKTVTQQLPLPGPIYVIPFFIDHEKGDSGPGNFDTVVALTNTKDADLSIKLIMRDSDGDSLSGSPHTINLGRYATKLISLSDLIQ